MIRMQKEKQELSVSYLICTGHCPKQRLPPGWYLCLKCYAPERNNANGTRQINSDCEHKQQPLSTQTQLMRKSEHKNQTGSGGQPVAFGGF